VNDFNRAFADESVSVVDQNRLHTQIAYDIVDIVNQIITHDDGGDTALAFVPLRNTRDVAFMVAQAAARLRVWLADGSLVPKVKVSELENTVEALCVEIDKLEDECNDYVAQLEDAREGDQ
jgi:hypothetical protein